MGAYAPDSVVAQVRALALQGYRSPSISKRTNVPVSTVHRWLQEWESLGTEQDRELLDQERRIGLLSAQLYENKLEAALEGREPIKFTEAAVGYGISRSKLHERAQRGAPNVTNVNFVLVQAPSYAEPRSPEPTSRMELPTTFRETKHDALDTEGD